MNIKGVKELANVIAINDTIKFELLDQRLVHLAEELADHNLSKAFLKSRADRIEAGVSACAGSRVHEKQMTVIMEHLHRDVFVCYLISINHIDMGLVAAFIDTGVIFDGDTLLSCIADRIMDEPPAEHFNQQQDQHYKKLVDQAGVDLDPSEKLDVIRSLEEVYQLEKQSFVEWLAGKQLITPIVELVLRSHKAA